MLPDVAKAAEESVSEQILTWGGNAEAQQPYVKKHNVWGARHDVDQLITSEGWRQLRAWCASRGVVATAYEKEYGPYKRLVQHASYYFVSPASGLTNCPLSMTDGAAKLLGPLLPDLPADHPFHDVYKRLIAREDAWTSGQWMTERPGGSDVQNSETWAKYAPLSQKTGNCGRIDEGDYLVSGFKFFSSATDANVSVMLAKTESGKLSAFIAPLTKTVTGDDGKPKTVTNGVRIHRLKQKLGTKQLPTAELELNEMRAHLVGPLDQGVKTIAAILNITRLHALVGSTSGWRRCMNIAKAFAKSRVSWGVPLWLLPLHLRTLAEMELKLRACMQLSFFTVALMSFTENGFPATGAKAHRVPLPKEGQEAEVVLRTMTALGKGVTCKLATSGIQECMEAMGGVGYMDEPEEPSNVARAFRDIAVNCIWEGTTNVLSSELVRNLQKGSNAAVFEGWLVRAIGGIKDAEMQTKLQASLGKVRTALQGSPLEALGDGRRIMFSLAWVIMGMLLTSDAERDGDAMAQEVARRWVLDGEAGMGDWLLPGVGRPSSERAGAGESRAQQDCLLVWGVELPDISGASSNRMLTRAKM